MRLFRASACGPLLLALNGCGSSIPAAATRVVAVDTTVLSTTPVCFVPPSPKLGLTERAQRADIVEICEGAARKRGVSVVPFGGGQCLAATVTWATRDSGDRDADCYGTWAGAECHSTTVHVKSLKLVLAQALGDNALAETTAVIRSSYREFSRESFLALCTAAFHDYPRPLSRVQFDVSVD